MSDIRLKSAIDKSINLVDQTEQGYLESRYVRRVGDYFICYLSSQTGCNRGCRFCHLTTTKQTQSRDATFTEIWDQAAGVLREYASTPKAKYVHYNFMSRGEPLDNKIIYRNGDYLLYKLGAMASGYGLKSKFNISTILPKTLAGEIGDYFNFIHPTVYYSLYSADESFRKKWLPNALPTDDAGQLLSNYQKLSKKVIKLHSCFIRDGNDTEEDMFGIIDWIGHHGLKCEFNIVRYNPYSDSQGEESNIHVINRNRQILERHEIPCKEIPRVGFDVKASCGMFYSE